ncbi:hypothetical protein WAI453_005086 [Rhynchosporium graminicola]
MRDPSTAHMMDLDDHVTTTDRGSMASKRGNLRRSCESCRGSKGRCISSPGDAQRCMRCVKDGRPCVFLEAKPRPKRAKNSRVRVAEMEEKLESLLALVAANVANQSLNITPATPSPSCIQEHSPMPTDHVSHQSSNISATGSKPLLNPELSCTLMPDSSITRFASAYDTPPSSSNPSEQSFPQQNAVIVYPIFDNLQDVISKGLIGLNEVEDALRLFRSKQNTFPFVVIPVNLSLDSLRRQRPSLFLAIMCCATEHNAKLQQHIELELKDNLSRRILVNGEKSLDLLQGILIYLTWYHLYFHPDREQIYQLSQMAVAMAVDLGLDKPVCPAPKGFSASNNMPFITSHPLPSADIEGMRAFLGCYFLTTSICQVLRKPSNMKHNERLNIAPEPSKIQVPHRRTISFLICFVYGSSQRK